MSSMMVRLQEERFDPGTLQSTLFEKTRRTGGLVTFTGYVRAADSEGIPLKSLFLEHYPGMTEKSIKSILKEAIDRWDIESTCVVHRVGLLLPRDPIVWVGSAAAHRSEAFDCCEFVMDYLKTKAPFWKKEETEEGVKWIDSLDSDEVRVGRWEAS